MTGTKSPEIEISGIDAALTEFQRRCPKIVKGQRADAGRFNYDYADLSDITEQVKELLGDVGLSFTATPTLADGEFVLDYALRHVSGQKIGGQYPLPHPSRNDAHALGSAITYARRYCFNAVTNISPAGDDDDGHGALDARAGRQLNAGNGNGNGNGNGGQRNGQQQDGDARQRQQARADGISKQAQALADLAKTIADTGGPVEKLRTQVNDIALRKHVRDMDVTSPFTGDRRPLIQVIGQAKAEIEAQADMAANGAA